MDSNTVFVSEGVRIPSEGGKTILEMVGRVATKDSSVSIARMVAPAGWDEPAQTPEFAEYTLMVRGRLQIVLADEVLEVSQGQLVALPAGSTVQYRNPFTDTAEYWSVCIPAFSPETANREL